jgi:lipopolysaccharide transport system permease protein
VPSHATATSALEHADTTVRRIQPSRGLIPIDFAEVWRYRELLYFLVWRDIKARYKQVFLGPAWALLRPLVTMVLFSVIFGGLANIEPGSDHPYPLFVFAGLLAWMYLAAALPASASSIVNNANLVAKAYFPRMFAPAAAVTAPIVDLALSLSILFGLFAWYGETPGPYLAVLPAFLLLALLLALGGGLLLASITIRYRDVPFALPFAIQAWLYVTPVIYPPSFVPADWRWLLALNPATGIVEGFRWSILGSTPPSPGALAMSIASAIVLFVAGALYFRRSERTLVDLL